MKTVLATKILTFSQKQYLLNAGFAVLEANFIDINFLDFYKESVDSDLLIFTSKNAVKSVLKNENNQMIKKIPAVCVGTKTKSFLEREGWQVDFSANTSANLAKMIVEKVHPKSKITFFNGNLRKNDLPNLLKSHNFSLKEIEVYQTLLTPHKIEVKLDAILFFSPSAVDSYLSQNKLSEEVQLYCIGKSTAKSLKNRNNEVIIAKKPSVENVIIQCIKSFRGKYSE